MFEKTIDASLMKYVPKSKRDGISQIFRDDDGIWIFLKDGWNADRMDYNCHVIHEDYISELRWQIAGIRKLQVWTADRETGTFIERCDTIEEAKRRIEEYETSDKEDGTFKPDFYDIVDENHCRIL